LKRYTKDGGNVNAREETPPRRTLLHLACELRLTTAAQQFVEAGADVNAIADDGITPLMSAQSADVTRLLLHSGAVSELRDDVGRSALYLLIACANGNADVAKLLLKRCSTAILTQAASSGFTPLNMASQTKNEGLALLVLAAHPADYDGNEELKASNTASNLYAAAGFGSVKLAEALLKRGADVNRGYIGQHTRTPYMFAAQEGHLAMLDLLQQHGADVNAMATDGYDALLCASGEGQLLVARCTLRHGADLNLNVGRSDRPTPLYAALTSGHLDVAKVLLSAGARPGCSSRSLIEEMLTQLEDDVVMPMLKLLQQHWGTDVAGVTAAHIRSAAGYSLLLTAVTHKRLNAARYLVSIGADVYARDEQGCTVAHHAAQYNAVRVLRWLVLTHKIDPCEAAADDWLALHCACHMGSTAAVEYLLSLPQAAAMLAAEIKEGYTALHCAADSEHDDIVQLLLSKGAAVDARSHTGVTPLMQAQLMRAVTALVNAHADVNAVDNDGSTVLHHCAKQGAAESVYKLLLKHSAVPTAVDVNGSTPAHVAGMSGHFADEALLSKAAEEYSRTHANDAAAGAVNSLSSSEQKQQRDRVNDITSSDSGSGDSASSSGSSEAAATADSEVESSSEHKKQKLKQPCANVDCKQLTTKLCRRCAAVYYCSTECQKVCSRDPKHRGQCNELASAIV
jgi:ankyrin repeat protein